MTEEALNLKYVHIVEVEHGGEGMSEFVGTDLFFVNAGALDSVANDVENLASGKGGSAVTEKNSVGFGGVGSDL
jgi:hypothetical protein